VSSPKILYIAPIQDYSGYAHAARDYIRALDLAGCDLVTRALRYDNGGYKETAREKELAKKDVNNVKIVIQQTTPNETQRHHGVFNVNYFAWETDRIPTEWVNQLNQMDLVLVPCEENTKACRKSGVMVPVVKVPHTFDTRRYEKSVEPYHVPGFDDHFKFLSICQYAKKKGIDALLKGYFAEFRRSDKVLLVLKMYMGPNDTDEQRNYMAGLINEMKDYLRIGDYAPVLLLPQVMSDEEIEKLYAGCDAYVLPSRGEGWSITHFDAMGWGVPPIGVNWGGPSEFITPETGWLVDYNLSPVCGMPHPHQFMYTGLDKWAEPHVDSLMLAMRQAVVESKTPTMWERRKAACKQRAQAFDYCEVGPAMRDVILTHYEAWRNANASN
jgi:glycosyltransferase involved in cell wall biosynthesis